MTFSWAPVLYSLLLLPLLVAGYVLVLRRRRRRAVLYSSVALIRAAAPTRSGWRRHLPFALLLLALAGLGTAGARPQVQTDVPVSASSVIIALDVSGSMCATDVDPNRLTAAQSAVRRFIQDQGSSTRIGLVVFSGFAQVAVPSTTNRDDLLHAVDTLTTGRGTTIGAAILKSLDAIAQINPNVAPAGTQPGDAVGGDGSAPGAGTDGSGGTDPGTGSGGAAQGPPGGRYAPEIIVLLTDGANTRGVTPAQAAQVAASRGVRVYPIGFGTTEPTTLVCSAAQLGGNAFNDFGAGRFGLGGGLGPRRAGFLVADEPALRQVAATTGGTYFSATRAEQLQGVLADLPRQVQVQKRDVELSAPLAGLAAVLVLLAFGAAARWSTRSG